jgi:hypothetical protein
MIMNTTPSLTRILILTADPSNEARLRLDREIREIRESWKRSRLRDQHELVDNLATRPGDLQSALRDARPAIVHFGGHGSGPGGLVLEDGQGLARLVSSDALAGLFRLFEGQVLCVILNSCHSAAQAEVIVQYVPYVVGMTHEIGDDAAICFSRGFYDALFDGEPFERAFEFGCNQIALDSLPPGISAALKDRHVGPEKGSVVGALPEYLKPELLVRADFFIRCHPSDEGQIKKELVESLKRAGQRVTGDWLFRGRGADSTAHEVSLRISRHVLVVWTRDWCDDTETRLGPPLAPDDSRVRVLVWEDIPPPDGLPRPAVYDFSQPQQRRDPLLRLFTDLELPVEASSTELTQTALEGLDALRKLMETDEVRDAVRLVLTTLTRARNDIIELNRWKQLHDLLHGLNVQFPPLLERKDELKKTLAVPEEDQSPEDQQRAVERCWRKVREVVNQPILPSLRVLVKYAGPPDFQPAEVPWVAILKVAQEGLDSGSKNKDLKALLRGVELLGSVLGQWMPKVNQELFDAAKRGVPIGTLVGNLETIAQAMGSLTFTPEATGRVEEFRRGITALRPLHSRLQNLVDGHNYLQTIDSLTIQLDDPEVTAEAIDAVWKGVAPTLALLASGAGDDWVGELGRQGVDVDQKIPPALGEGSERKALSWLREAFSDFRSQLASAFLLADQTLKKFIEDLQTIRESLTKAIEGMRQ